MLYTRLYKKIINKKFIIAVFVLFLMYMAGKAGKILSVDRQTTVFGFIVAKLKGIDVHNMDTQYFMHATAFWGNNQYTAMIIPFIACLPGLGAYFDEIHSGNKRFIVIRGSKRKYYCSEIVSTMISSGLVVLLSVLFFQVVLLFFFDAPDINDMYFGIVYSMLTGGKSLDPSGKIDLWPLFLIVTGSVLRFVLYGIKCALFAKAVAVITRDIYLTLGFTAFLTYFHQRLWSEVYMLAYNKESSFGMVISDIINPYFLQSAGSSGFYQNRLFLAFGVQFFIMLFWIMLYFYVSEKREDVSLA